jgi:tellurite resistance protein TerC
MNFSLSRYFEKLGLNSVPRVRKTIVAIIGGTVLLFGIILIFLPGPSFLVIPAGLAILATEFVWAQRWLQRVKNLIDKTRSRFKGGKSADAQNNSPSSPPASTK